MPVRAVFGARSDGDLRVDGPERDLAVRRARLAAHPWTWLRQTHGAGVVVVSRPGQWAGAAADAAVTSARGAVLAVHTADCVPVLLRADGPGPSAGPVIGAVHAGWRGLYDGVVEAAVAAMGDLGARRIEASIGPCISPAAYEFGEADLTTMALRFGPDVVAATSEGSPALDLVAAATVALRTAGVDTVDTSEWGCTATTIDDDGSPRWFSHRARLDVGRQASVTWIEP